MIDHPTVIPRGSRRELVDDVARRAEVVAVGYVRHHARNHQHVLHFAIIAAYADGAPHRLADVSAAQLHRRRPGNHRLVCAGGQPSRQHLHAQRGKEARRYAAMQEVRVREVFLANELGGVAARVRLDERYQIHPPGGPHHRQTRDQIPHHGAARRPPFRPHLHHERVRVRHAEAEIGLLHVAPEHGRHQQQAARGHAQQCPPRRSSPATGGGLAGLPQGRTHREADGRSKRQHQRRTAQRHADADGPRRQRPQPASEGLHRQQRRRQIVARRAANHRYRKQPSAIANRAIAEQRSRRGAGGDAHG